MYVVQHDLAKYDKTKEQHSSIIHQIDREVKAVPVSLLELEKHA